MKGCSKCGLEKPDADFYTKKDKLSGLTSQCRTCISASARERRCKNIEYFLAKEKASRENHREQRHHAAHKYYVAHREERLAYGKQNRLENIEHYLAKSQKWNKEHRTEAREYSLKRKYGINYGEYMKLFHSQSGICFLCGNPPSKRSLHVDHDHNTGRVRALLCGPCNHAIGLMKENPALLRAAANYLEKFNKEWSV